MNYLLDTDILIDWLQGRSWAKEIIFSKGDRLYCSAVTRTELLSKPGITGTERERIIRLLRVVRVLNCGCSMWIRSLRQQPPSCFKSTLTIPCA